MQNSCLISIQKEKHLLFPLKLTRKLTSKNSQQKQKWRQSLLTILLFCTILFGILTKNSLTSASAIISTRDLETLEEPNAPVSGNTANGGVALLTNEKTLRLCNDFFFKFIKS